MVGAFAPPDLVDSQCTTVSLEGAAIRVLGLLPVMLFHIFTFLVAALAFLCPLPEVLCRRLLLDHCWDLLKGYQGKILKILFTTVLKKKFFFIVVVFVMHWQESVMDIHVFPILIPPPTSLPIPSLWVFPVHRPWAPVSCIQPGLVICFTLDNIHASMLFSQNIPPSPSPTESKSLFYTSVSLFLFCI